MLGRQGDQVTLAKELFVQFPSGAATFRGCSAVNRGGSIFSWGSVRMSGSLDFVTATSRYGGGMYVEGNVDASRSNMSFSNCRSIGSGGGDQKCFKMCIS